MRLPFLALALALALTLGAARAAPVEPASDAAVARFVSEAVVSVLTRGGENGDAAWLARLVSVTSTEGANGVLAIWREVGVPDEPAPGTSYAAQVSGTPDVKRLDKGGWRARAVVFQTFDGRQGQGGTGMEVEAGVTQDPKSGALVLDRVVTRR